MGWTELTQDRVQKRGVEPSGSVTGQLQPRSSGQFGILHNRELQLRWGGNTAVCACDRKKWDYKVEEWMVVSKGVSSGRDAPTRNLQNIKNKHTEQPAKKTCDTLPHPHVASVEPPRLEATHLKNVRISNVFYAVLWSVLCNERIDFVVLMKALFMLSIRNIYIYIYVQQSIIYVYKRTYG